MNTCSGFYQILMHGEKPEQLHPIYRLSFSALLGYAVTNVINWVSCKHFTRKGTIFINCNFVAKCYKPVCYHYVAIDVQWLIFSW